MGFYAPPTRGGIRMGVPIGLWSSGSDTLRFDCRGVGGDVRGGLVSLDSEAIGGA